MRPEAPRPDVLHAVQPGDGGVARVVTDLVRAQLAAGLWVAVACPPGTELAAMVRAEGADTYDWRAGRDPGPRLLRETRDLARLIRTVRPALVHAHSAKAGLCARLALRGRVPTVYQPHAWSFEAVEGTTAALALRWERWAARWSAAIVCVSEAERHTGETAGVRARWSVIHNGVDTARFAPPEPGEALPAVPAGLTGATASAVAAVPAGPTRSTPSAVAGVPAVPAVPGQGHPEGPPAVAAETDAGRPAVDADASRPGGSGAGPGETAPGPLVVCVGRLCRQKGQDVLLAAWPAVVARVPGARLVLVGDGPEAERLRAAAPASVRFTGAVADPAPWYRAADVVVLPSRWEGMALAPLEAMACGRPVVVADVDGARESLPPGHEEPCLVPPEDPTALAAALGRLLGGPDLRHSLGRQAREHVLSRFDVRRTGAAVAELYREVAGVRCTEHREPIAQ
ncbi:glycosyltransferase [Streptomyces sp. NPDC126499]|uniref:glycosyltransferase n=1 Tax=Streptomyces sp. NPDC126499 TaxID=3155314 RepID=UPI003322831B